MPEDKRTGKAMVNHIVWDNTDKRDLTIAEVSTDIYSISSDKSTTCYLITVKRRLVIPPDTNKSIFRLSYI